MSKLLSLQNVLFILDKQPTFKISLEIDNDIKEDSGNDINLLLDNIAEYFLNKYKNVYVSISPINALQELCLKKNHFIPSYSSIVIDGNYQTTCTLDKYSVSAVDKKKKLSKNKAAMKMIKLLSTNQ